MTKRRSSSGRKVSTGMLLQMLEQNRTDAQEDHARLRESVIAVEVEQKKQFELMTNLHGDYVSQNTMIKALGERPIEISSLRMTPQMFFTVAFAVVGICGGMWASTAGLREGGAALHSEFQILKATLDGQANLNEARVKVSDERAASMRSEVNDLKTRSELWKYDIQKQMKEIIDMMNAGRKK